MTRREPLGDQAAVVFGAAEDLGSVALDDESNLHDENCPISSLSRCSMQPGAKSSSRRRCPSSTDCRNGRSYTSIPIASAASSRSFGVNSTPAPPSVSGTAPAAYASTGTLAAIASTRGTQNPSCSLRDT